MKTIYYKILFLLMFTLIQTYFLTGLIFALINKNSIFFILKNYYFGLTYDALLLNQPNAHKSLLISFIIGFCTFCFLLLSFLLKNKKSDLHGHASFAKMSDIKKANLLKEDGVIIGKYKDKTLYFGGTQFVALQAPTRSGKGVSFVIPNLLAWKESLVVLDIKKECFTITSKYRQDFLDNKVFIFDPFSNETHKYNPLDYIDFKSLTGETDLNNLSIALLPNNSKDSFWTDNARILFNGLVYLLKDLISLELTDQSLTLCNVVMLKEGINGHSLKEIYDNLDHSSLSQQTLKNMNKYFGVTSENTLSGINSTFDSNFYFFTVDVVANATSSSDFDLRKLRHEKITIYISINPSNLIQASKLINLLFSQIILENTKELPHDNPNIKYKCLVMLDEMTSIGYMPIILKGSAFIAGYNLRLLMIYQSMGQLGSPTSEGGYGATGAKSLTDNSACNLIFTPKIEDAKAYSDSLGYVTVKNETISETGNRKSKTTSEVKRALMLPQELCEMPFEEEIVKIDAVKPIRCQKFIYFKEKMMIDKLKAVSPTLKAVKGYKIPQRKFDEAFQKGETFINFNKGLII